SAFLIVQLHLLDPRPERLIQQRQKAPSLDEPYLSVGSEQSVPLFFLTAPPPRPSARTSHPAKAKSAFTG
ncbi:hypothetical protein, partial [Peribacillus frigoritolerans]|uniref:hypothetical protein n=1 Tax=Peribacillus frigoritolerans TaxID=450367 RepID=UPI00197F9478